MPLNLEGSGRIGGLTDPASDSDAARKSFVETGYRFVGTRTFTSDGTFSKSDPFGDSSLDGALMRAIRVRVQAGGGGGGGAAATTSLQMSSASGGQGGNYAEAFITNIAGLSASESVTVGLGGAGGAAGNNSGAAGGVSSFGTLVTANGGREGIGSAAGAFPRIRTSHAAEQGTSGADVAYVGRAGFPGWAVDGLFIAGNGGYSFLAPESQTTLGGNTSSRNGPAGIVPGGGGSGGGNGPDRTAVFGGNGAAGIVIVEVYA
jgi:hypothetical protein